MKKTTFKKNDLRNAFAGAMLFFSCVNLSAQAPVVTANAAGGKDYTFTVAAPGNLKTALETLKPTFTPTSDQKDNFIITGELNADDMIYFGKGGAWAANSWNLNSLDMAGATTAYMQEGQFDGIKLNNIKKIILPGTLTVVPRTTFAGCTSEIFGASVTTIGENCYSWARWSAMGVFNAKTQYPSLTTLKDNAFAYNDNGADFTGIILPATFTTFGNNVFSACPKLASIVIESTTPPSVGSFGNRDAQVWNGTEYVSSPAAPISLYVPASAVDAYKAIPAYVDYFGVNNIKSIGDFATSVKSTGADALQVVSRNGKVVILNSKTPLFVQVYGLSGNLVASETINTESSFTLTKGCYIVKAGVNKVKVII